MDKLAAYSDQRVSQQATILGKRRLLRLVAPFVGSLLIQLLNLLLLLRFRNRSVVGAAATNEGAAGNHEEAIHHKVAKQWANHLGASISNYELQISRSSNYDRITYGNCPGSPSAIVPAPVQISASTDSVTKRTLPSARQALTPPGW